MIAQKIKTFLDKNKVNYEHLHHKNVYKSIEEAKELGIQADEVAKTLAISLKGKPVALVVIAANDRINSKKLRRLIGNKHARLATEEELETNFKDVELGAIPPLGPLFNLPVYFDKKLEEHQTLIFWGGTHTDSIKISFTDLFNLLKSKLVDIVE